MIFLQKITILQLCGEMSPGPHFRLIKMRLSRLSRRACSQKLAQGWINEVHLIQHRTLSRLTENAIAEKLHELSTLILPGSLKASNLQR